MELCDGIENDCDGLFLTGELTDQDLDGYLSCDDCDDADPAVNASAVEDCGDGIDNDCDGSIDGQQLVCQVYTVDITTSSGAVDVASSLGNPSSPVAVIVTIFPGVTVESGSTSTAALTTAGLPAGSTVEVLNQGTIQGRGGDGACENQGAGGNGGDAIVVTVDVTLENASGFLDGGGGGGGSSDDPTGGVGGAGGGVGCLVGQYESGGVGGEVPSRWGAIPGGLAANYDGSPGTGGAWGNPGSSGGGGSGGAAQSGPADWQEGQGGAGGGWGGGGGGGSGQNSGRNPGPGGDAGYAVRVQSGSLTWVAGNTTTQVKGLAQ